MSTNIIMMSLPGAVSAAMTATRTKTQRQDFRMVLPRIRPSMLMPTRITGMMKAQEKVTTNFRDEGDVHAGVNVVTFVDGGELPAVRRPRRGG